MATRPDTKPHTKPDTNPDKVAARILGERGEDAVAAWYLKAGYRILDRNWRCREGELDIVAGVEDTVVFCEVKSRSTERYDASTAVGYRKQAKLHKAALRWLESNDSYWPNLRFDVAVVISGRIRIIEDAF